jgi:hypothetical protein
VPVVSHLVSVVLIVALWLAVGFATAARDRLAKHAASWLLPSEQAVTVRVGYVILRIADSIMPSRRLTLQTPTGWIDIGLGIGLLFTWPMADERGVSLAASLAHEIDADILMERRVINPIRTAMPVLKVACCQRLRNLVTLALALLQNTVVAIPILICLPSAWLRTRRTRREHPGCETDGVIYSAGSDAAALVFILVNLPVFFLVRLFQLASDLRVRRVPGGVGRG